MSVAQLKAANSADVMKSEEPNDSLDTLIRQAIGKEPFLSFSRAADSPVQWIQLLHALDQQDLPGWPLLTPLKVQMQKCDKCSREFCSPINYRRHVRVHHRLKKLDKDTAKNRDLLAAFWDKLSEDEAKEVVAFKDVSLEEVPGSSVIKSLTTLVKRPGFSALPQVYLRAGSALLDIVQARPSRFLISSEELFSILDDASEKTFLCGAALSMQKYIFDGEAGKIGLETKNLVACTSFLVEQKLVRAWLADKDAEALRCQKLLVEEEEAAWKRQAEILERKRQKKLRQKERKAKEQRHGEMEEVKENMDDSLEVNTPDETSSPLAASDCDRQNPITSTDQVLSSIEPIHFSNPEEDVDYELQVGFSNGYCDPGTIQNVERRMEQAGGRRRWKTPSQSQRGVPNGFHAGQNSYGFKFGGMNKHGANGERVAAIGNSNRMWSRKPKAVNDGESFKTRAEKQAGNQLDQDKKHEVLIGSISVTLGNCSHHEGNNLAEAHDRCLADCQIPKKNNVQEKSSKLDPVQGVTNRSTIKFWRPVSRHESKSSVPVQNGIREFEVEVIAEKDGDQTSSNESCLRSWATDGSNGVVSMNLSSTLEESVQPGSLQFDSHAAKAFLAQRWKEAITGEHVTLVFSPNLEPPGCSQVETDSSEKWMVKVGAFEASTGGAAKGKFRTKPEKGAKIKYIPKQRSAT